MALQLATPAPTVEQLLAANRLLQLEVDRLTLVAGLQREIAGGGDEPAALIVSVLERAQAITNASGGAVEMVDGEEMVYRAASGNLARQAGLRLKRATSLSGRCAREGVALLCADAETDPRVDLAACRRLGIRSMVLVPLRNGAQVDGVLKVTSREPHAFAESDLRVLELLGGMIGAALARADLIQQTRLRERAEGLARHLRSIAETIPQIVWTATADGHLDYYNQRWYEYTGLTVEQTRGQGWKPVIHQDDVANCVARWTDAYRTGAAFEVEYRFKRASDGTYRWHLGRATPVLDSSGTILKWFGTCTDIEDQKRAAAAHATRTREEGVRQGEERMRAAFDHSGIGMALVGLDGRCQQVNTALCRILGYGREELLSRDFQSIINPDDLDNDLEQVRRVTGSTSDSYEIEKRYLHKDGSVVWVLLTPSIVRSPEGAALHFIVQLQDITEKKRAEEELRLAQGLVRRSETLYRAMARNFPNGSILLFDQDLRFLAADGAGLAEMGLSHEALEGLTIHEVFPPETCRQIEPDYRAALAGEERHSEVPYRDHFYDCRVLPVRDLDGSVLFGMAVTQDVTGRKRTEARILSSLREKEVLLKEVHHRVKNNLQLICSLLSLQSRKLPEGDTKGALRESRGRVEAIAELHERLYRSGNLSDLSCLDYLDGLARGALKAFAIDNVSLSVGGDAISLGVDAAIPCGLIVNELITNSLKYAFPTGRPGKVTLDLKLLRGQRALLSIEDDGVGVPPDFEERRSRSLGLQLVATLAGQLGGTFKVTRGAGARFEVEFPLHAQ